MRLKNSLLLAGAAATAFAGVVGMSSQSWAFGEAGPLNLRQMGHFYVGIRVSEPGEGGAVTVSGQSYVGFALPDEQVHDVPVLLIHGGGGQASDWLATVDGRDGWANYLVAAGIDTYWIDRPGLGRSPTNPTCGGNTPGMVGQGNSNQIAGLAASENWPGAQPGMLNGVWDEPTWVANNIANEAVLGWLATSPGGPYCGNGLAIENIVEITDRVGPMVLFGHSAGGASTIGAALAAPAGSVKGVLIFESGVNLLSDGNRAAATWDPPLPEGFMPVDVDGCMMQPEGSVSRNVSLADIPFTIIRSEHGNQSDEAFACSVRQLRQMGVEANFVSLPANGFPGGGHFMMSDTNSGEIATEILVPILVNLMGHGDLPAGWTVVSE